MTLEVADNSSKERSLQAYVMSERVVLMDFEVLLEESKQYDALKDFVGKLTLQSWLRDRINYHIRKVGGNMDYYFNHFAISSVGLLHTRGAVSGSEVHDTRVMKAKKAMQDSLLQGRHATYYGESPIPLWVMLTISILSLFACIAFVYAVRLWWLDRQT